MRVVKMLLIHDVVEIDAGDAFLHDLEAEQLQAQKEAAAAQRIFSLLPQDQSNELIELWEECAAGKTAEASFARAFDRMQPVLLHGATEAVVWAKYSTTQKQILDKVEVVKRSAPGLWPKVLPIIQHAKAEGKLT